MGTAAAIGARGADFGVETTVSTISEARSVLTNFTAWSDRLEQRGPQGQESAASLQADLRTGAIRTWARGFKPGLPDIGGAGGTAQAAFWDVLRFTVPAGEYPEGRIAVLRGLVTGALRVEGEYGEAGLTGRIGLFGPWGHPPGSSTNFLFHETLTAGDPATPIRLEFTLAVWLAQPGFRYAIPESVKVSVWASLSANAGVPGVWGGEALPLEACSDLGKSLQILELEVPPGVTWTSASGVFLTAKPEAGPRLSIHRAAPARVEISWPVHWSRHELEAMSPAPGGTWVPVPAEAVPVADRFVVTVEAEAPQVWFRLREP